MSQKTLGTVVAIVVAVITSQLVSHYDQVARHFWSWQATTSGDGAFTVEMPGRGTEVVKPMPMPAIHTTLQTHEFPVETSAGYFMMSYVDYPQEFTLDPEKALPGARDGAVANVHGELISSAVVQSNGLPAMRFSASTPSKTRVEAMCVLRTNRLYMLMLLQKTPHAEDAEKFFQSFKTL